MAKERRFVKVLEEGGLTASNQIWMDTVTGVQYLFHQAGYGGGLTALLDENGKPVITPQKDIGRDVR